MLEYILRNTKTYVLQPHIYLPMYKRVPLVSNTLNGFLLELVAEYIIAHTFMDNNLQGSSRRPRAVGFRLRQPKGFYLFMKLTNSQKGR